MSLLEHTSKLDRRAQKKRDRNAKGPKTKKAVLSNFLFLPKSMVKSADEFKDEFEYLIDFSKSTEARTDKAKAAWLRSQLEDTGLDPDVLAEYADEEIVKVETWHDAGKWWALCRGNVKKTSRLIKRLGLEVKDRRVEVPLDFQVKMVAELRPDQKKVLAKWLKKGYGILKAAPAFGKTVVACAAICEVGQQTLVLVHTDALAEQFIERFRHGAKQPDGTWKRLTNCLKVEKQLGGEIIGRYSSRGPLYPIMVATYQAFIRNDRSWARFKDLQRNYGHVLCDEAHRSAAPTYSRVINATEARYRRGMTATPDRKDSMEKGVFDIVGPVTAIGKAKQLPVVGHLMQTGFVYKPSKYPTRAEWSRMVTKMLESGQRNAFIFNQLKKDVEAGRNVLILADRVEWCFTAARHIREQLGIPSGTIVGGAGKKGPPGGNRDAVIKQMLEGKIRVICATKVLDEGVDIANLDTLYIICPMNNAPVLEQRLGRIRRPYDGKQTPLFRYFVDDGFGALMGCAKGVQKTLVNLGIEVHYVSKRKSDESTPKAQTAQPSSKGGFKSIASRRNNKVNELFEDAFGLSKDVREYREKTMSNFDRRQGLLS